MDRFKHLAPQVQALLARLRLAWGALLAGQKPAPLPPEEQARRFRSVSPSDSFVQFFIEFARLKPGERVLEVGSGLGRIARRLARYLSPQGEYRGLDLNRENVEWCLKHITPRSPNFHFHYSDVYHSVYNPGGRFRAADYRFPYPDGSIDFAFQTATFNHLYPDELENYLAEIARVLRPGGRFVSSFFLLNGEARLLIQQGRSTLRFQHEHRGVQVLDDQRPDTLIAHPVKLVRDLYAQSGLRIRHPIYFGSWCGRKIHLAYQDLIVAVK